MMPEGEHSPREFFSRHAEDYAKSKSHALGFDLTTLVDDLQPRRSELALDVATGTGFTAMALASRVKEVVAIDLTQEMLDQAKKLATERGITNVRFEKGEASDIRYPDSSFDIVTARRAAHHFRDVPAFVREARRVLLPGGRLGLADMSPPEGCGEFFNLDATHVKALSLGEWRGMLAESGLKVMSEKLLSERIAFEDWLYPVTIGGKEEAAVRQEWQRAPEKIWQLLHVQEHDGQVKGWIRTRMVLVARK
jgi:ubiquinone/menaquinone biosynthesis C-methylase UbiE